MNEAESKNIREELMPIRGHTTPSLAYPVNAVLVTAGARA